MKKVLSLVTAVIVLTAFIPSSNIGFGDLAFDGNPASTYGSQYGNFVTVKAKVLIQAFPNLTTPFKVGFYLSTDTTISLTDKKIATYTVVPGNSATMATFTISNIDLTTLSVANNTYYIGAYVDIDNDVAENGTTPEFENNAWAFRNGTTMKTIVYPAPDASIGSLQIAERVSETRDADHNVVIRSRNGEQLQVNVTTLEGKLIFSDKGEIVVIPSPRNGVYFLEISNGKESTVQKRLWQ
jgi:hypothetical protein